MSTSLLYADKHRPRNRLDEDEFGYDPFARDLAVRLHALKADEGFVVGVQGSWGTGKTTMLSYLKQHLESFAESERPICIPFNAWAAHSDLTRLFLIELHCMLEKSPLKDVSAQLGDLASLLDGAPGAVGIVARVLNRSQTLGHRSISQVKDKLREILSKSQHKVVVFVDDMDRLQPLEVPELFKVIKAVADLPNLIFVLAYDRAVLTTLILHGLQLDGGSFLEKIVQVQFDLPAPEPTTLHRLLLAELRKILGEAYESVVRQEDFWLVFEAVRAFINSPRNLNRLLHAYALGYESMKQEINPIDLLGIETVRNFATRTYEDIRNNLAAFVGGGESTHFTTQPDFEFLGELDPSVAVIVALLFPKFQLYATRQTTIHSTSRAFLIRPNGIANLRKFPLYFGYSNNVDIIAKKELIALMSSVSGTNTLVPRLIEMSNERRPDGRTLAFSLLEQALVHLDDLGDGFKLSLTQAVLRCGDGIWSIDEQMRQSFEMTDKVSIERPLADSALVIKGPAFLFEKLFFEKDLGENNVYQILLDELKNASLRILVLVMNRVQQENYLDNAKILTLTELVVARIKNLGPNILLTEDPHVLLRFWLDHDPNAVKEWLNREATSPAPSPNLLRAFLSTQASYTMGQILPNHRLVVDNSIHEFLEQTAERTYLENLLETQLLSDSERRTIRARLGLEPLEDDF